MIFSGIYMIKNKINNKVYIGSSKDIKQRWNQHKAELKRNKHHSGHLQFAYNKYGSDNFEFSIIEIVENVNDLFIREQYWLDFYKSYIDDFGYNIRRFAGLSRGFKMSKESIDKMIKTKKKLRLEGNLIPSNAILNEEKALIAYWLHKNTNLFASEIGNYFGVSKNTIQSLNVNNWNCLDFDSFNLSEYEEYYLVNEILTYNNQLTLVEIKEIKLLLKFSNLIKDDLMYLYNIKRGTIDSISNGTFRFDVSINYFNCLPYYLEEINYQIMLDRKSNKIYNDFTRKLIVYFKSVKSIRTNDLCKLFNVDRYTVWRTEKREIDIENFDIPLFYQNLIKLL